MTKKILLMTDLYYPNPSANGICLHQVACSLLQKGYEVHVLCFQVGKNKKKDVFEGINIHRVKPRLFFRIRDKYEKNTESKKNKILYKAILLIHRIKKIMFFPLYPLTSPTANYRYYNEAKKICNYNQINNVLGQYNPIEAAVATLMLKKKYPSLRTILYVVDSFTANVQAKNNVKIKKAGWNWEKRFYINLDMIINMKFLEKHHQAKRYDEFRKKIIYLGIPLVRKIIIKNKDEMKFNKEKINCVYTGTLDKNMRNPKFVCDILSKRNDNINLHFYSRGNCESMLTEFQNKTNNQIQSHGKVSAESSLNAMNESDILISIGNRGTEMVPSKIFEYISFGKPIIHFYKDDNDSSLEYLLKYPLALCIKEDYKNVKNVNKLVSNFIEKNVSKTISFNEIKELFSLNTPDFTSERIDDFLKI
ncbi:hypothetical protein JHE06_07970 [Carnobacterium sp. CS13]|uniref:hypothetical protein n=1 Tax=Carnobacterium sp. CS13 TaxID=2800128 RepID=UPI0019124B88|nr:hypothetical protein [Carnobacterium sp. CS13]QQP69551.1 hypothetical protein JHE06_07970 [Carnobacterium sp. CS13]